MKISKKAAIMLLLSVIILLPKSTNQENNKKAKQVFRNSLHEIIWRIFKEKNEPEKTYQFLQELKKEDKNAYKLLIPFLHKKNRHRAIVQMIPELKAAFPSILKDDPTIGFMVAYALVRKNVIVKNIITPIVYNPAAMDILIPLNRKFPTHQKVAALTATLYDLNRDPQNALAVSEKYLNTAVAKPTDFVEHFKNADRYNKIGNKIAALKSIKKCTELQPKFTNGWVKSAAIKDQLGKTQEAIDDCIKALETSGTNKVIEYMLIQLFFKLKKSQHRISEFITNRTCFEQAIRLLRNRRYNEALAYMDKCLSEKPQNNSALKKNILKFKVLSR